MSKSKLQVLMDATKRLLDLQKDEGADYVEIEAQLERVRKAYTDYHQQPDHMK